MNLSGSWQYIEDTARNRLAHNKTKRHVSDYGEGIEVIGVAGELLVRRFLGLAEHVHEGFDHGVDIHYFGMRMDVKATVLTPNANFRYLQWANWKKVRADYIIMTVVDPINRLGTIIGYVTKDEILAAPINPNRTTPCHEIPFTSLHPAWELIVEACRRRTSAAIGRGMMVPTFPALESAEQEFRTKNRAGSSTRRRSGEPATGTGSASRGSSSKTGA